MLRTKIWCLVSDLLLHTDMRCVLSHLMVHTQKFLYELMFLCYTRTYDFLVQNDVTYGNVISLNLLYPPKMMLFFSKLTLHTKTGNGRTYITHGIWDVFCPKVVTYRNVICPNVCYKRRYDIWCPNLYYKRKGVLSEPCNTRKYDVSCPNLCYIQNV